VLRQQFVVHWRVEVSVVSEIDGLMFTLGDGPGTRLTAAPAPRCLESAQRQGSSGIGS
jgi:hypothetical protein